MPLNTDINFQRLSFSNQSATNSRDFPWKKAVFSTRSGAIWKLRSDKLMTCITRKTRSYFRFAPPPTPGTKPFQTIPHPRARRAGLVPGVARGGMVTGKIEPCISCMCSEGNNQHDRYAISRPSSCVGYLPREISRFTLFLFSEVQMFTSLLKMCASDESTLMEGGLA